MRSARSSSATRSTSTCSTDLLRPALGLPVALAAERRYVGRTRENDMPPIRVVLDCNIWDELNADPPARERTRQLCEAGAVAVVVPDTLHQQLIASPLNGIPNWFPTTSLSDTVFVVDHSRLDHARLGRGTAYADHKGDSRQVSDAVIVDCADTDADVFVSQDRRARERYARMRDRGPAMDYDRFRAEILSL